MKRRWIAAMICLLYMSVGWVAAGSHDHAGEGLAGHRQCDACAWHHDSQVDVPVAGVRVCAPETIFERQAAPAVFSIHISAAIHGSRGPPAFFQYQ